MGDDVEASWLPDPTGRFEHRYWNGTEWTEHVSRAGRPSTDPLTAQPSLPPSTPLAPSTVPPEPPPTVPVTGVAVTGGGFAAFVKRTWRAFRRWPTWAQVVTWGVVAAIIIGALASGSNSDKN